MTGSTVARSYAEALFELGERHGVQAELAAAAAELVRVLKSEPRVARFLESPRVEPGVKAQVLATALGDRVPPQFLKYLQVVLQKRRMSLLLPILAEYRLLLDEYAGRLHVTITLAREPDEGTEREIASELSRLLGRQVIPHITVDPAILGGIVVRYGDRLIDGSLRRRIQSLRHRMLSGGSSALLGVAAREAPAR